MLEREIAIRERNESPNTPTLAAALNNLGLAYVALGRLADAETLFERALAIRGQIAGMDETELANVLLNLAGLCESMRKHQLAAEYERRAREILDDDR